MSMTCYYAAKPLKLEHLLGVRHQPCVELLQDLAVNSVLDLIITRELEAALDPTPLSTRRSFFGGHMELRQRSHIVKFRLSDLGFLS